MLTTVEKILFLQRAPMFEGLSSRHLRVISDIAEEEQVGKDQLIFEEGQPGERMFIIVDGQVQIEKALGGGKLAVLATLERRDIFGDMAILDDQPRSASARALSDVTVLGVDQTSMKDLIREYPDIAFGLLKFCAERIRESNKRMQAMSAAPGPAAAAGTPMLTVVSGPDSGKSFKITTDIVKLGRSGGEEIEELDRFTLRDSAKQVSRNHAEILRKNGAFYVKDAGSTNGTFLNDKKVNEAAALKSGDTIRLGAEAAVRFEA